MKSSYYVAMKTNELSPLERYAEEAGALLELFRSIFTDDALIRTLTHNAELTAFATEVEVSHTDDGLVAAAVVDIESTKRVGLDKSKLAAMLKSRCVWQKAKVEKRALPVDV